METAVEIFIPSRTAAERLENLGKVPCEVRHDLPASNSIETLSRDEETLHELREDASSTTRPTD